MSAAYIFVTLPLDTAPDSEPGFALRLLSTIEFSAGRTSGSDIAAAVRAHPLLGRDSALPLRALAMPYAAWASTRKIVAGAPGVQTVELSYRGKTGFDDLRAVLADYLARPGGVPVAPLTPDKTHDKRAADNFLDIAGAHDRLNRLRALVGQGFAARARLRPASLDDLTDQAIGYAQRRWLDGNAQAVVLALLFGDLKAQDLNLGAEGADIIAKLRIDIARQRGRLTATKGRDHSGDGLRATSEAGDISIDPRDPNAAMHAALANGLIAENAGIVTEWAATSTVPLAGDHVIALDPATLAPGTNATCKATAFRRAKTTHPLSYSDIGKPTRNGGLVALNDDSGAARYSATGVNAEVALFQGTILQAANSMMIAPVDAPAMLGEGQRRRDDRAPVELGVEQLGFNELEAAGLTLSAPVDDLVTPGALKSADRETDLPCLFLEDLWIGYRLDLAVEGQGGLQSVHRQKQRITLSASARIVRGEAEDYWPREAPNADLTKLSTEIIRFNGLSAAQALDYGLFLGTAEPPADDPGAPFRVDIEGAAGVTPLRFGETYAYRLRTVFQGGISLSDMDPGLDAPGAPYVQKVSYRRARSYRAGEVIMPDEEANASDTPHAIFLSNQMKSARILVAPTPVDTDTARFNGQFLSQAGEAERDAGRAFVTDLSAYLRAAGREASYYCDPDVAAITIEIWMRNGDPQSTERGFAFQDGVYCEMVEPLHLGPVVARFGPTGRWREFRPIEIILTTTTDLRPKLKVEAGGHRVRITVPVAADIELVLTPVVAAGTVQASARFAPSTSLLSAMGGSLSAATAGLPVVEHRIRAVHCTRAPIAAPRVVSEANVPGGSALALLKREPTSDRAELAGYIDVDAASSGELQIAAAWKEIDDDPLHERYLLKVGQSLSRPRSLQFRSHTPPGPALAVKLALERGMGAFAAADGADRIGTQCAENRVFLGGTKPVENGGGSGDTPSGQAPPCVLALGNSRRARLSLTASAKARYAARFAPDPKRPSSLAARPLAGEVPASMALPAPLISHVMPLVRELNGQDKGRRTRERLYAFRIYVRRPWFLSGHGERLAIGCHAGTPPSGPRNTLAKTYSQWGEDPIARTRSQASKRLPRATDFRAARVGALDPALYPADAPEGNDALLYLDDIVRDPATAASAAADGAARLALASYALRWDDAQKLWFCDVELANDFAGWIGLALYRHQPHAHEGFQISEIAAWLYSQQLRGERVTWFRQNGILHVTIGPVYDRTIGFEAEQCRYRSGVSLTMEDKAPERFAFQSVEVDGKLYFEGRFAVAGPLEIVRRRFDFDIASFTLETS